MSTRAIIALVKIIKNVDLAPGQRIEACEMLLEYEAPPNVVEFAKKYLASVYDCDEPYTDFRSVSVNDKLRALKLIRKFEAARIKQRVVAQATPSAGSFDPGYLVEREARGRELLGKVETMDEIRARLNLTFSKTP